MSTTEHTPTKGFAILVKAPDARRTFFPREGETITITDKTGKELWTFKSREGQGNPGVIIFDVKINLLTEREFGRFCQNTRSPMATCPSQQLRNQNSTLPPPPLRKPRDEASFALPCSRDHSNIVLASWAL